MDKQKALELINKMPVVYYDTDFGEADGETVVYTALVDDNEHNRSIIKRLGYSDKEIDGFESWKKDKLEITNFVWDYANWFDGERFKCL